ncbi:MAG: hypothetical protein KF745_15030 [Phycisphaeraceae bacterium]|nr:hypothetical protein [Phycisphaeraceae bacterium]
MSQPMNESDARIESYLDGTLVGAELAAFEAQLSTDAALRSALDVQLRLDARLRAVFAPPPMRAVKAAPEIESSLDLEPESAPAPRSAPPAPMKTVEAPDPAAHTSGAATGRWRPNRVHYGAIAAVVAIAGGIGVYLAAFSTSGPSGGEGANPSLTATAIYSAQGAKSWTPDWACKDDEEFKDTTRKALGRAVLFHPANGVALVGWTYGQSPLSGYTSMLLAKVEGRPVLVLMGKSGDDARVPGGAGLNVFKRSLPGVVMYEITPLDRSAVIDHAYEP